MVADDVTVYSRPHGEEKGFCWRSNGDGSYELSEVQRMLRMPATKSIVGANLADTTHR